MLIGYPLFYFATLPQEPDIHHHGGGLTIALAFFCQAPPIFSVTNGVLPRLLPYTELQCLGLDL